MKVHCRLCNSLFVRSTRTNKTCEPCAKNAQLTGQKNRSKHTKKKSTIAVVDRDGKFAGFVTADNDDDLALIQIPRGYKKHGDII